MKKLQFVLFSVFALALTPNAFAAYTQPPALGIPLHCQGYLTPAAGFENYVGQVALYFVNYESRTATLWHQYPNGTSKFYAMSCKSIYVGDGPSDFACVEDSTDALKFGVFVGGSYGGGVRQASVNVERGSGEDTQFVAGVGSINCQ